MFVKSGSGKGKKHIQGFKRPNDNNTEVGVPKKPTRRISADKSKKTYTYEYPAIYLKKHLRISGGILKNIHLRIFADKTKKIYT